MKSFLIGCLLMPHLVSAAVHPIKELTLTTHASKPYLEASVTLESTCSEPDGSTLVFDSETRVITLVQQVKDVPTLKCAQSTTPIVTEFALEDLPVGVFRITDGFDNENLGVLWVKENGETLLLENF